MNLRNFWGLAKVLLPNGKKCLPQGYGSYKCLNLVGLLNGRCSRLAVCLGVALPSIFISSNLGLHDSDSVFYLDTVPFSLVNIYFGFFLGN